MAEINQREQSSGNIFADLNIPEPSLYLAKAELANQIYTVIQERNLTQVRNADALPVVLRRSERQLCAADILGINQPKVSALTRGNLDGFSSDRLFKFLNLLGQDIEIVIRPHTDVNREAGIKVS
jgi:predicted XRE-type DNA-binding protein